MMTAPFAFRWLASLGCLLLVAAGDRPASCPADGSWQRQWMRDADWGWSCRYRADDALLRRARHRAQVVFMGDSITEMWGTAAPDFFRPGWIDRGISGQTTPQMLQRFEQDVVALRPRVVHIMAGTNDIAGNTGPMTLDDSESNLRRMAETARAHGLRVVIGSVLPARAFSWNKAVRPAAPIAALNRRLRDYAARRGFSYADYYSAMADNDGGMAARLSDDGVHPNGAGYAVMAPIAEAAIRAALKPMRGRPPRR